MYQIVKVGYNGAYYPEEWETIEVNPENLERLNYLLKDKNSIAYYDDNLTLTIEIDE